MAEQVGALCWRLHKWRVQVLLVTSRDTGRWVLPKGWPMAGKTAEAAAAREAWEEAGVEGLVQAQSIGRYCYDKIRPNAVPLHHMKALLETLLELDAVTKKNPFLENRFVI